MYSSQTKMSLKITGVVRNLNHGSRIKVLSKICLVLLLVGLFFDPLFTIKQNVEDWPTRASNSQIIQRRLPQVIIIGCKKCGTTVLKYFISRHPRVKIPQIPEPHFFDDLKKFSKGADFYRSLMPLTTADEITLEKTPRYFPTEEVPLRIKKVYGKQYEKLKIVVIVCNPVDRFFSEYVHELILSTRGIRVKKFLSKYVPASELAEIYLNQLYEHMESMTLNDPRQIKEKDVKALQKLLRKNENLALITNGLYYLHLEKWLLHFSLKQILVVDGEGLLVRPWEVINEMQDFLEIPRLLTKTNFTFNQERGLYCIDTCAPSGKGRTRSLMGRKTVLLPNLNNRSRAMLNVLYRRHNEAFFQRINKTFYW